MEVSELVRRFEPILRFSKDASGRPEHFFPMDVANYVAVGTLRRKGEEPVDVGGTLTLRHLADHAADSNELYVTYVAHRVLSQHPSFRQRWRQGGVALYRTGPDVRPHLRMPRQAAVSYAPGDAALQRVQPPRPPDEPVSFALPGGSAPGDDELEDYLIRDWFQLPEEVRDLAQSTYQPFANWSRYPPVYSYRVQLGERNVIHYWFFYAYNDWGTSHGGLNDHEGDWESIFVFLNEQAATHVVYSSHNGSERATWDSVEKVDGHPVVYVGCGSHASYLRRGAQRAVLWKDYAQGDGEQIGPGGVAWGSPRNLDDPAEGWVQFAGGWGALIRKWWSSKLATGSQGPRGPAWHGTQWSDPWAWSRR